MASNDASNDVLIAFVLDRSGSMFGLTDATIEGFNQFLEEQRRQPGGARMSLTLFNTEFEVRYAAVPLADVPSMGRAGPNLYQPGGRTALLDALGTTIKSTEQWIASHPEFTGRVLIATWTDGFENASREWHINQPMVPSDDRDLCGLIDYKQREGWEFMFLGTGGSNWLEQTFGSVVAADRFVAFAGTAAGQTASYGALSNATTVYRNAVRTGEQTVKWAVDRNDLTKDLTK